jgi:acyl carrier protein
VNTQDIKSKVKSFVLAEFLPGEDASALTDVVPLISTGILDSIAVLKLVAFLEEQFQITLAAHEADVDNLNTVADIARLVESKLAAK